MKPTQRFFAFSLLVTLSVGCQTYDPSEDVPARIDSPNDVSRAELQHAVNSAMGREVVLADDALTDNSTISIERRLPSTLQNPEPQGRDMSLPIKLMLVKRNDSCFLLNPQNDSRYLLESTHCIAE